MLFVKRCEFLVSIDTGCNIDDIEPKLDETWVRFCGNEHPVDFTDDDETALWQMLVDNGLNPEWVPERLRDGKPTEIEQIKALVRVALDTDDNTKRHEAAADLRCWAQ